MKAYAREIATLLKGSGKSLSFALMLSVLSAATDMACMAILPGFLFMTLAGNAAMASKVPLAGAASRLFPTYGGVVVAVVVIFLLRGALSLFLNGRISRLSEAIHARVIGRLMQSYLTCPYAHFSRRSVAEILAMTGSYAHTFSVSVALPLLRLMLDLITLAAILAFLMVLDFRMVGMIAVVLVAVAVGYYLAVRGISASQSRRLAELQADLGQQLSRALHSPREVRIFQLQNHFLAGLRDVLGRSADAQARLVVIGSVPRVLGEMTLIGLALGYFAYRMHSGTASSVLVSQFGLLGFAGLRLLPSFAQALNSVSQVRAGRHVTRLLAAEFEHDAALTHNLPPTAAKIEPVPFESLQLVDVSFAYGSDRKPVLDKINLTIARNQSIGVVGASGAGKSTLADLLLGLLSPGSGEVRVNGVATSLAGESWWHTVGFVPQTVFLTNDSLLRNIAFGVPEALIDRDKARRAAEQAQLDDVIRNLPSGIDTVIGDYGVRLSGGQRQRVAIARALYHDRQFLVLDEATSALDSETERAVVSAIGALRGSITTFIIAHRRSTLDSCDAIVELADGHLTRIAHAPGMTDAA